MKETTEALHEIVLERAKEQYLRHECLAHQQTQLAPATAHISAHARLPHSRLGPLFANPLPDVMRGVPLLADKIDHRI
jgi:hypothetical protein